MVNVNNKGYHYVGAWREMERWRELFRENLLESLFRKIAPEPNFGPEALFWRCSFDFFRTNDGDFEF